MGVCVHPSSPLFVICHREKFSCRVYPKGLSDVPKRLHYAMVSTSKAVLKSMNYDWESPGRVLNSEV